MRGKHPCPDCQKPISNACKTCPHCKLAKSERRVSPRIAKRRQLTHRETDSTPITQSALEHPSSSGAAGNESTLEHPSSSGAAGNDEMEMAQQLHAFRQFAAEHHVQLNALSSLGSFTSELVDHIVALLSISEYLLGEYEDHDGE